MLQRKHNPTERVGIIAVAMIVTNDLKWIWREQHVADFGVDGQIEVVDSKARPTGRLLAVQVKSGSSYFRGKGIAVPFQVDESHLKYWDQHSLPVIVVLHDPATEQTIWQWADAKTARATPKGWCIDIPRTKTLSAHSNAELLEQVWNDDSYGLRRRFALDRELMKEFAQRDAFVTIDAWVNKSLTYRSIDIHFDDPDKAQPDYVIPIMATWNYEVGDIVRHFLPWLDHEYHEEVDDSSSEIERHVFAVWLSKPAKAFLEVEAFFENPPLPPVPDPNPVDWEDRDDLPPGEGELR